VDAFPDDLRLGHAAAGGDFLDPWWPHPGRPGMAFNLDFPLPPEL